MVGPVEYALVLPPLVVVVMMEEPVEMAESVEYA
jgi:cytochrome c oxidase subunit IV